MVIRNQAMAEQGDGPEARGNRVLTGLALIMVGVAIIAGRMDLWEIRIAREMWPWIPIAIGVVRVLNPPLREGLRRRRGGAWLIFIGLWGLISEYALFGFGYRTSWPLLIVGAGLNVIWRALEKAPRQAGGAQ